MSHLCIQWWHENGTASIGPAPSRPVHHLLEVDPVHHLLECSTSEVHALLLQEVHLLPEVRPLLRQEVCSLLRLLRLELAPLLELPALPLPSCNLHLHALLELHPPLVELPALLELPPVLGYQPLLAPSEENCFTSQGAPCAQQSLPDGFSSLQGHRKQLLLEIIC